MTFSMAMRVLAATAITMIGLVAYDRARELHWVGHFQLQVRLISTSSTPIHLVRYQTTLAKGDYVREIRDGGENWPDWHPHIADDFDGDTFSVSVKCSGAESGLMRRLSYAQMPLLLVWVELANGRKVFEVIEIPDGRRQREVTLQVP